MMDKVLLSFLSLINLLCPHTSSAEANPEDNLHRVMTFPVGSVHNCPTMQLGNANSPLLRMDALPGFGFDSLRTLDLGQVFTHSYSHCQISSDGLYLIPDSVHLIPILNSDIQFMADVFDDMSQWKSETAASMSADVSGRYEFTKVNAKFSAEYKKTRSKLSTSDTRITRVGIRHHLYSIDINIGAQLNPYFKSRVFEIAANIINRNHKMAHYLSELLVRDYGTHVITSIDVGASLSQTTTFRTTFSSDKQEDYKSISAAASVSFASVFKVSVQTSLSNTQQNLQQFRNSSTSSYTTTHGGPAIKMGQSDSIYSDWENGILDHLVAIDRRGDFLSTVLTVDIIPELTHETLLEVSKYVNKAIKMYYNLNTKHGCTNMSSENFDPTANVDSKTCKAAPEQKIPNYLMGGLYTVCENSDPNNPMSGDREVHFCQDNPVTNDKSCPPGSESTLLYTGHYNTIYTHHRNHRKTRHHYAVVDYKIYWCAFPSNQPYTPTATIFGGIYSSNTVNELTGTQSCPPSFKSMYLGPDMYYCYYDGGDLQDNHDIVKFGGLYSNCGSQGGNPMADESHTDDHYPMKCPVHFSPELISVEGSCVITYCIDKRMPTETFIKLPDLKMRLPPFNRANNSDEILQFTDTNGHIWRKNNRVWKKIDNNTNEHSLEKNVTWINIDNNTSEYNLTEKNATWINNADDTNNYSGNNQVIKMSYSEFGGILVGVMIGTASVVALIIGISAKVINRRKKPRHISGYKSLDLAINNS